MVGEYTHRREFLRGCGVALSNCRDATHILACMSIAILIRSY